MYGAPNAPGALSSSNGVDSGGDVARRLVHSRSFLATETHQDSSYQAERRAQATVLARGEKSRQTPPEGRATGQQRRGEEWARAGARKTSSLRVVCAGERW